VNLFAQGRGPNMDVTKRLFFNEWKIVRLIGEGSYGKVYLASKNLFGETVFSAIKIITIPQNQSQVNEEIANGHSQLSVKRYFRGIVDEWQKEISILNKLKGAQSIVIFEDFEIIEYQEEVKWDIVIRMEYLTPLSDVLRSKVFMYEDGIKLGIDLAKALSYCSQEGIIHRDIKPENIFLSKYGDFKLGDFGIAKQVEMTVSMMSKKGTYLYMAPEVFRGETYDKTVDIYSLGLVLFRLFNDNKLPFLPMSKEFISFEDREKSMIQRIRGEAMSPPKNSSSTLSRIILKCCEFEPSVRYQDPRTLYSDLLDELKTIGSYGEIQLINLLPEKECIIESSNSDKTVGIFQQQSSRNSTPKEVDFKAEVDEQIFSLSLHSNREQEKLESKSSNSESENNFYDTFKEAVITQNSKKDNFIAETAVLFEQTDVCLESSSIEQILSITECITNTGCEAGIETTKDVSSNISTEISLNTEIENFEIDANEETAESRSSTDEMVGEYSEKFKTSHEAYNVKKTKNNKLSFKPFGLVIMLIFIAACGILLYNEKFMVKTINVVGMSRIDAAKKLESSGLKVKTNLVKTFKYNNDTVINQSLKENERIKRGSEITLDIAQYRSPDHTLQPLVIFQKYSVPLHYSDLVKFLFENYDFSGWEITEYDLYFTKNGYWDKSCQDYLTRVCGSLDEGVTNIEVRYRLDDYLIENIKVATFSNYYNIEPNFWIKPLLYFADGDMTGLSVFSKDIIDINTLREGYVIGQLIPVVACIVFDETNEKEKEVSCSAFERFGSYAQSHKITLNGDKFDYIHDDDVTWSRNDALGFFLAYLDWYISWLREQEEHWFEELEIMRDQILINY
jgi:serine/threonine protein kinase